MSKLSYAYYPGCASKEITKEADKSTRKICDILGIELIDMPKANCCGAGLMTDGDPDLNIALNARIFAEAEAMGKDIMTVCATCFMVMNKANFDMANRPGLFDKTNEILKEAGLHYSGNVKVKHLLWVLKDDYGLKALKDKVTKPIDYLKVAPFYGCHSLRPSDALGFDDPENPTSLEEIIRAIGGEAIEYFDKTKCCGFQVDLVTEDNAVDMTALRLHNAKIKGPDCMVTPCPFCHINLDNYQGEAEKKSGQKFDLPIFHLAQLVGLSLGLNGDDLGLSRHLVNPAKILSK